MRMVRRLLVLTALLAATNSCGDVVRSNRSPVILVLDLLQAAQGNHNSSLVGNLTSDVVTLVTTPSPCSTEAPCSTIFNDVGLATLHITPKDIGVPAFTLSPSPNNQVTITRYHVEYRRADGRNTPGVDVPFPFDGGATGTVAANGTLALGFELVRHTAKEESPLLELRSSRNIISTIATVTFFGTDIVGNAISVAGSITIDFGNFGDT
jgi:hypothetical protein